MKRSRDMIISQILDICINGASKTRIVYQANLNFRTIGPYLELLTKNELINVKKEQMVILPAENLATSKLNGSRFTLIVASTNSSIKDGRIITRRGFDNKYNY